MSDVLSRELPAPRRWQELESLAFDVYSRLWKTTDAELHGRTGQPQAGVDVYGTNRIEQLFTGVQCKGKDSDYGGVLTEAELRAEVEKALTFQPPLDAYVILTTAPNDAAIQAVARQITAEHKEKGLFEVRVTGWDTFRHHIASHQDLLVKYFRDFAPVDILEHVASSSHQQAQGIARVEGALRTHQRFLAEIREGQAGNDDLATRITEIGRLIGDGLPKAALKALVRIEADEGTTASPLARYRLLTSKGNAFLALGDYEKAASLYREAHAAHPKFANAKATLAMACHIDGEHAKAFRLAKEALKDDPLSVRNSGVLIDTATSDRSTRELQELLFPDLLKDIDVKLHLAIHAASAGEHDLHRSLSEEALLAAPDDWRAQSTLAEALMQPFATFDALRLNHELPEDQQAIVQRATQLMESAWATISKGETSFRGRHVAANLISLLELAGRDQEAAAVLDEALVSNPGYGPLILRAAYRSASAGDWRSVANAIDPLLDGEEITFDGVLLRTQAALAMNDPESVTKLCDRLESVAEEEPKMPERDELILGLRAQAKILSGIDKETAISTAIESRPESVVLRSVLFDSLDREDPVRKRLAAEIQDLASRDLTLRERVHAAETLYAAGSYSLAADLYASLCSNQDSPALRRQLEALYLADRRADARKLFESLPTELKASSRYLNIGINIYERAGLLKPALALLEKALKSDDALHMRLGWIQLLVRLGREHLILPWLKNVSEDIEGSAEELMTLARVIDQKIGHDPRSLILGYRALRAGYNRPQIHLSYAVGLIIMGRPAPTQMQTPEGVEAGTGVELLNEETGEKIYRIIEVATDPVLERGELPVSEPFAQALLGMKIGDSVLIEKAGRDPQPHRLIAIHSRYLFAQHRTLREFQALFPGNTMFGSFEIDDSKGDDRFEDMFAMARRRAEHANQILGMYRESSLPLPMIAKFSGANVFELWDGFSRDPNLGLKAAIGASQEFAAGIRAATDGLVVVDPVSVYAWALMSVAETLENSEIRFAVVQSTIDALRELVEERREHLGQKMGSFGWDGEGYRMVELTEETLHAQIDAAENALALALSMTLVPAESDRDVPDRISELLEDYHPAYQDTLLAATQPERTLLTDDLGLRVIAQEIGIRTTFTQATAQAIHASGGIDHPKYRAVVGALVEANYRFTQLGPYEILGELIDSMWTISARLETYARLIAGPTVERMSVARVLGQLLVISRPYAPDVAAFAAFHVAFAKALREEGREDEIVGLYGDVLKVAHGAMVRNINSVVLRGLLLGSTHLASPEVLTYETRRAATDKLKTLRQELLEGGFNAG